MDTTSTWCLGPVPRKGEAKCARLWQKSDGGTPASVSTKTQGGNPSTPKGGQPHHPERGAKIPLHTEGESVHHKPQTARHVGTREDPIDRDQPP